MARGGQYLTDLERLAKYRQLAEQAHESARNATATEAKSAYASMARAWECLIEELERMLETGKREGDGFNPDATLPLTKSIDPDH